MPDGITPGQEAIMSRVDHPTIHLLGNLVTLAGRGAETGGGFSLMGAWTAPGQGTPPHLQGDDEAFYVLEGAYEFMVAGKVIEGRPGTFVFVPRGTPHAFRNVGTTPARMVIINTPAGFHEGFFLDAGDRVPGQVPVFPPLTPPDVPKLIEDARRWGIEILPPPA